MTAWDRQQLARSFGLSAVLVAVAAGVLVATDEPSSGAGDRVARLSALAPVLGALAVAVLVAVLRRTGEARALASLGVSPLRAGAGLWSGASLLSAAFAGLLLAGHGSLRALFPRLAASPWSLGNGVFQARSAGVRIGGGASGDIVFGAATRAQEGSLPRITVALLVLAAAVMLPAWASVPAPRAHRVTLSALSCLLGIVAFHSVAAGAQAAWLFVALVLPAAHLGWLLRVSHRAQT